MEKPHPTPSNTDPSALGGNVTNDDGQELYDKKVDFLADILKEQDEKRLEAQKGKLIELVGGQREAEKVDIWQAVSKSLSQDHDRKVSNMLPSFTEKIKELPENDIFDKITKDVWMDFTGDYKGYGHDSTSYRCFEADDLMKLAETGEIDDPVDIEKTEKAIMLLVTYGLYKFNKWWFGSKPMIEQALSLLETCTRKIPGFDPSKAGLYEATEDLTMALASIQVDQDSKPNYEAAMPERESVNKTASAGLTILRRTQAHEFLRSTDFVLPDASA